LTFLLFHYEFFSVGLLSSALVFEWKKSRSLWNVSWVRDGIFKFSHHSFAW